MRSCQGAGGTGTLYTYAQLEGLWIAADKSTSTSTSTSTKAIEACLVAFPNLNKIPSWVPVAGTSTYACIISKSEARGVIGGLCLIGGGITGAVGLAFIAVFALGKSGVAQTVVKAVR